MKKNKITLEDLANMVQKSLLSTEENIKTEIKSVQENLELTRKELRADMKDIKADLNKKVDVFVHNDLKFRVEKLEEKVGAGKGKH